MPVYSEGHRSPPATVVEDEGGGSGFSAYVSPYRYSLFGAFPVQAGSSSVSLTAIGAGTVGAPSIAWSADADGTGTGFYRPAANTVAVAINGALGFTINVNGVIVPSGSVVNFASGDSHSYIYRSVSNTLRVGDGVNSQFVSGRLMSQSTSGDGVSVASGSYARFDKTFAGAPTAGDCDDAAEQGRIAIDTTNHRFYWCQGAAGWKYATGN